MCINLSQFRTANNFVQYDSNSFFPILGKLAISPIEVAMGWKADCFLFHLVVEYCTNPSSLFFLLLTHSPKVFAQGKGKIVTKKLLIQINVFCHLKLFGRLVRTIVLSKMSKMHLFFKRNGCKMLQTNFLRLTFSFTSLLSNFFQPSF